MSEVTRAELERLTEQVEATQLLVQRIAWQVGVRSRDEAKLYKFPVGEKARAALHEAGVSTLDDLAGFKRQEVAALPGIGATTMVRLDAALDEHMLDWELA